MIVKTSAIVLKVIHYSESSLIVTLMTKKHGKIAVIAKGARKPKSKFSGMMALGQILEVVYYYKPARSVQTLSDAAYLQKLLGIRTDIFKIALISSVLELVNQLIHENEINNSIFTFLLRFLPWINDIDNPSKLILPYVQIQLAQITGIGLQLNEIDNDKMFLNIDNGVISGHPENNNSILLTIDQYQFIKKAIFTKKSTIFETELRKSELKELIQHLDKYFRYHVEGMKERKSDRIFNQLFDY
ncbi:MAG: DNA repair protein RecO [Balneolaceae bacterium]